MKKTCVLLLFLLVWLHLVAQKEYMVSAGLDKNSIIIGQPLQLTLEASFSNAHTPSFFTIDSLAHFEILNRSTIDTQAANGQTILKQIVTLTSWDSGAWVIPAFSLSNEKRNSTNPLPVNVTFSPMAPNQDYHGVKDIIDVQKPPRTTWYWYVVGVAILLLLLLLLFPKTKKSQANEATLHEGAYQQALNELNELHNKTDLDDKIYFTELIQILRTYLHRGKGIHSFQKTTEDLSRQLKVLPLPHEDLKKLIETLQLSDFIKFAQLAATANEREEAWQEIKKSIAQIEPLKL